MDTARETKVGDEQGSSPAKGTPAIVLGVAVGLLASRSLGRAAAIGGLAYALHRLTARRQPTSRSSVGFAPPEREKRHRGIIEPNKEDESAATPSKPVPKTPPPIAVVPEADVGKTPESGELSAFTLWTRDSPDYTIIRLKASETALPVDRQRVLTRLRSLGPVPRPVQEHASPFTVWIRKGNLIPNPCTLVQPLPRPEFVSNAESVSRPPPITPVEVQPESAESIALPKFETEPFVASLPPPPLPPPVLEPQTEPTRVAPLPSPPGSDAYGTPRFASDDAKAGKSEFERKDLHLRGEETSNRTDSTATSGPDVSVKAARRRLCSTQTRFPKTSKDFPYLPLICLMIMMAGIVFGLSYFIKVAGLPVSEPASMDKANPLKSEQPDPGRRHSGQAVRLLDPEAHISRAAKDLAAFLSAVGDEEKAFLSLDANSENHRAAFRANHGPKTALTPMKITPLRKDAERSAYRTVPFSVDLASGETVPVFLYLDEDSGRFKLDWDLWVQCRFNLLEEFQKTNSGRESDFCVNIKRGHVADTRLRAYSHLQWCVVTVPGSGIAFHAVAAPDSPGATQVKAIGWQSEQRVRITARMEPLEGVAVMKITHIEPDAWGT